MRNLLVFVTRLMLRERAWRIYAIALALLVSGTASAGLIVVAGDSTPVFSLTDTLPDPATAGNRQFFSNVLGSGTSVLVQGSSLNSSAGTEINEFYNSLPGVTSTLLGAGVTVTAADLAGKNLFLAPLSDDAYTAAEIAAIDAFVGAGGSLYMMGDGVFPALSADINALLAGIGSSLSLGITDFDDGLQTASGPEILVNALTSGVLSFNYGATVLVSGGTPLFLTNDLQPFVAIEGGTPTATVPEPTTVLLFIAALLALGIARVAARR